MGRTVKGKYKLGDGSQTRPHMLTIRREPAMVWLVTCIEAEDQEIPKIDARLSDPGSSFYIHMIKIVGEWDDKTHNRLFERCTGKRHPPSTPLPSKIGESKRLVSEIFQLDEDTHVIPDRITKKWPGGHIPKSKKGANPMARRTTSAAKKPAAKKAATKKAPAKKTAAKKAAAKKPAVKRGAAKKTGGSRARLEDTTMFVRTSMEPRKGIPTTLAALVPKNGISVANFIAKAKKMDIPKNTDAYIRKFITGGIRRGHYKLK